MTIQERVENYELTKMTQEERVAVLTKEFQNIILNTILGKDPVCLIRAHSAIFDDVYSVVQNLSLPEDFVDPGGSDWETSNTEFNKFCMSIPVKEISTEELEGVDAEYTGKLPDSQLFLQIIRASDQINIQVEGFLEKTGAKGKIMRSGLPFEPTIAEKRMVCLMVALLSPEQSTESTDQVLI